MPPTGYFLSENISFLFYERKYMYKSENSFLCSCDCLKCHKK